MLKKYYGEVILKKDLILYHTSEELFNYKNNKSFLFCIFHPSEWDGINDYIHFIKLKKNLNLLFMIESFRKTFIFSSLHKFINSLNENLAKKNNDNLMCFSEELKKENFDGWFTSIENKATIEVALLNDKNIFEVIKTEELRKNWRNGNYLNNKISIKNWGQKYKIYTLELPIIFNINERFKERIDEYIKYNQNSNFPNEFVLQVIFNNAIINYHKSYNNNFIDIKWKCIK
jgi:hypothetical protein